MKTDGDTLLNAVFRVEFENDIGETQLDRETTENAPKLFFVQKSGPKNFFCFAM